MARPPLYQRTRTSSYADSSTPPGVAIRGLRANGARGIGDSALGHAWVVVVGLGPRASMPGEDAAHPRGNPVPAIAPRCSAIRTPSSGSVSRSAEQREWRSFDHHARTGATPCAQPRTMWSGHRPGFRERSDRGCAASLSWVRPTPPQPARRPTARPIPRAQRRQLCVAPRAP